MDKFDDKLCAPYTLEGSGERARHGVLIIHGFGGSPAQLRLLAQSINELGYTVKGLLLPGHCTTLEDMARVSWQDYIAAVRVGWDELAARCDDVSPIGLSMGGLLSLIMCAGCPARACITLSAAIKPTNKLAPLSPVLKYVLPPVMRWPERFMNRGEDFLNEYDYGYHGLPLRRVADLMHLSRMAQDALKDVRCPLLVIQSDFDPTVQPVSAEIIMRGTASERKKLVRLPHPAHIITLGPDRKTVTDETCAWLESVTD